MNKSIDKKKSFEKFVFENNVEEKLLNFFLMIVFKKSTTSTCCSLLSFEFKALSKIISTKSKKIAFEIKFKIIGVKKSAFSNEAFFEIDFDNHLIVEI